MNGQPDDIRARAGLCGSCQHALIRPTRRGTVYLRCALATTDSRLPKYPRLPRLACQQYRGPSESEVGHSTDK